MAEDKSQTNAKKPQDPKEREIEVRLRAEIQAEYEKRLTGAVNAAVKAEREKMKQNVLRNLNALIPSLDKFQQWARFLVSEARAQQLSDFSDSHIGTAITKNTQMTSMGLLASVGFWAFGAFLKGSAGPRGEFKGWIFEGPPSMEADITDKRMAAARVEAANRNADGASTNS